jgi:glycosyltransferase involved in cell wall biosynthesis
MPSTWNDLIVLDGADFVRGCYRAILQRESDDSGFVHHLNALTDGVAKEAIAASIASGEEACVSGLFESRIAVRSRDALFNVRGDLASWLRLPPARRVYRHLEERKLRKRAAQLRARTTARSEATAGRPPAPPVEVSRIPASEWRRSIDETRRTRGRDHNFWLDLTTAFQWTGGVVGIVRAELEMAAGLRKIDPSVRFSMQVDHGFAEIAHEEIEWLLGAENVADAYMKFFGRYADSQHSNRSVHVSAPDQEDLFHPYEPGDTVVAAGWMDSQKERYFTSVKRSVPGIYLAYLVYDIIMLLEETRHFYPHEGRERFAKYIEWASSHCDLLLYGGETARNDTERYLKEHGLRVPPGAAVRFGTDIVKASAGDAGRALVENLGIDRDFILTVGSIEPRKNHETLYRAYLMALEQVGDDLPQLVIAGKPMWRADDLMNAITRHPKLKGRVLCLRPTDLELAALYENSHFTALPSIYEGWSLTLPESLGQGKFCLCSDTPPLREIGGPLVEYTDPFDVKAWAEKLVRFSSDRKLLGKKTRDVVKKWPTTHWVDTATMVREAVVAHSSRKRAVVLRDEPAIIKEPPVTKTPERTDPTLWMDLTFSYLQWQGGLSGVVRAELELARHFKALRPDTRFFAYQTYHDYFFEIDASYLTWLFDADDLARAYKSFHDFWLPRETEGSGYRNPFFEAQRPLENHPAHLPAFPPGSVVFFASIDSDGTGTLHRSKDVEALIPGDTGVMTSQLIYDLTPIKYPHFHTEPTCVGFSAFFEQVSNRFDHIIYGGRTAQTDGIAAQRQFGWRVPPSSFIEFGSDLKASKGPEGRESELFRPEEQVLAELGITSDFVLSVGTIEPRKNHEVLYKAYLMLLRQKRLKRPLQMVFAGKRGWNSDDFLATLEDDDRVKERILILSPTDEQLDLLYRRCLFTLLPSFYEGWSLTLPESLTYGKLCLTSDVEPLREVGGKLVDYIHPLDTSGWADRIACFANDPKQLRRAEKLIKSEWKPKTWRQSAQKILSEIGHVYEQRIASPVASLPQGGER